MSLEGYLAGSVLVEALKRNGPQLDTERLVDTLENLRDFDMGLGTPVTFGPSEHQGAAQSLGYGARRDRALPTHRPTVTSRSKARQWLLRTLCVSPAPGKPEHALSMA